MAVTTQVSRIAYAGDGATTVFAVPWLFYAAGDLLVMTRASATGVESTKVLTTDYSVSGAGNAAGGSVTFVVAPAIGVEVHIILAPARTQSLVLADGVSLPAKSVEGALDKIVLQAQRAFDVVARTLRLKETDAIGAGSFDAGGQRIRNLAAPSAAGDAVRKDYVDSLIPGTGSPTPPFFAQTAEELAAGIAPTNTLYPPGNVLRYGADRTGVSPSVTAFQNAIASGVGRVVVPFGKYRFTSGLTIGNAVELYGEALGGAANQNANLATLIHDFDGDFITFDGSSGLNRGAGGGITNLILEQAFGAAAVPRGRAIKVTGASVALRATWLRFKNLQIENASGKDNWTWAMDLDGSVVGGSDGVRDVWIESCRFVGDAAGGALRVFNAFNVFVIGCQGNAVGSDFVVSGPNGAGKSASVYFIGSTAVNLELDHAQNVYVDGGAYTALSTTANTSAALLKPSLLGAAPLASALLGSEVYLDTFDDTANLRVTIARSAELHRFSGDGQGNVAFADSAALRGRFGFGSAGHLFTAALANSFGVRSEAALHLGVGSTLMVTIREIGYGPGNGYIAVGGHTDPLSVLEVGGEASPELGLRSSTTGLRYTLQSNSDKTLRVIDRSNGVDRMVVGDAAILAAAGVRVLPNFDGVLFVCDHTGNTVAMYFLRKSTATQEVSDPSGAFTPTKDNAGTVNVYWDAVDLRFELQNNTAGARTFSFWLFGKS
jgi:hypothetical protein